MSKSDETHQSADVHDDAGHGHGHDAHPVDVDFVDETSGYDRLLQLVCVLAGAGLVMMMWLFVSSPITATEEHNFENLPPAHSAQ